jgi:hypothetical protein
MHARTSQSKLVIKRWIHFYVEMTHVHIYVGIASWLMCLISFKKRKFRLKKRHGGKRSALYLASRVLLQLLCTYINHASNPCMHARTTYSFWDAYGVFSSLTCILGLGHQFVCAWNEWDSENAYAWQLELAKMWVIKRIDGGCVVTFWCTYTRPRACPPAHSLVFHTVRSFLTRFWNTPLIFTISELFQPR